MICNKTKPQNHLVPPTQSEADDFFQNLHATGARSVILSLTSPYSDEFVPLSMQSVLPEPLTCLYGESCTNLEYKDLLENCENISISVTEEQAVAVEKHTRSQANSSYGFDFGQGESLHHA